jgi:hypothetical protein
MTEIAVAARSCVVHELGIDVITFARPRSHRGRDQGRRHNHRLPIQLDPATGRNRYRQGLPAALDTREIDESLARPRWRRHRSAFSPVMRDRFQPPRNDLAALIGLSLRPCQELIDSDVNFRER